VENTGKAAVAEFVATFALIFVGAGAVVLHANGQLDLTGVALAHGLVLAIMVSVIAHISGGLVNPAVAISLWVTGKLPTTRAGVLIGAEVAGAVAGAFLLKFLLPTELFDSGTGGIPALGDGIAIGKGIVIEAVTTFFLVFAVFGTLVDDRGAHDRTRARLRHAGVLPLHRRRHEPRSVVGPGARHDGLLRLVRLDRGAGRRRHHRGRALLERVPEGQGTGHTLSSCRVPEVTRR
jgi:glycerol uptake facilitator-like aquaporin